MIPAHRGAWLCAGVFLSLLVSPAQPRAGVSRELTFEDRVRAQEAIERVYYSHLVGTTQRFEDAVPREVLEKKVRTYLEESVALEKFWSTPVTAAALGETGARRDPLEFPSQRGWHPFPRARPRDLHSAWGRRSP